MNIGYNDNGIDMTRQVLYRNFHLINDVVYLVEISRNPKKVFILLFPNFERPEEYIQEVLTDKQATKLMAESGNIFENFIANFYVKFGKLQIRGFHGKAGVPAFNNNRTVSPGKQRMMSNIRGAETGPYGQNTKSRVVQGHAYGQSSQQTPQHDMTRGVSSQLSTDNFQSNTVLPAVNEYGPGDTSERKPTMFDPIPAENTGKKMGLVENNSHDMTGGPEANQSSIQQEIQAQESDR